MWCSRHGLRRKADLLRHLLHMAAQIRIGKRCVAEGEDRVALHLAIDADFGVRNGEAGAVVYDVRVHGQRFARSDEVAHLAFLDGSEKWHAFELQQRDQQPARSLGHGLDQQHARHQRIAGEVALEDRALLRDLCRDGDAALADIKISDAIDHLEIFEAHGRARQAPLAATNSSMRALRFFRTKYCSVVALPSFTSCVHFSSGSLMPKALSIAKAISRKSRLSMPRSSIAWLSGVMVSRGISQVSAMIVAT